MFKVNNKNTRTRCEICSKVNYGERCELCSIISIVNFEQVKPGWVTIFYFACFDRRQPATS